MVRFSPILGRLVGAAMLACVLLLAGCHRGSSKNSAASAAQLQSKFDTTVQAYKNSQFLLDGAVLSAVDLGSHFSYLKDQGQLPKTVLLTDSDDSKIRKAHLQFMARLQLDYGFVVYYERKGELVKISAVDTKARDLEDTHPTKPLESDEVKSREAGADNSPVSGAANSQQQPAGY